ncbi:DUF2690 domain-containing protein [Micromonospora sp. NPDC050417]|uniref:DUF2690 domain-containing protein n=1 Tax=Micromonospora sp. NPDC050417 TaxID=3364280 RepID=UPI0037BCFFF0
MRIARRTTRPGNGSSYVRRGLALLLVIVAALGVSMTTQTPAMAAGSGCGAACDGKEPSTYIATVDGSQGICGLVGASTIYAATNVELRYSSYCQTAWARQTGSLGWLTGVLVESYNANGTLRRTYTSDTSPGAWSFMVNDKGITARACFFQYNNDADQEAGRRTIIACTGRY